MGGRCCMDSGGPVIYRQTTAPACRTYSEEEVKALLDQAVKKSEEKSDQLKAEMLAMMQDRDQLQQENAKLRGWVNDAEQRIAHEQRWSTDRLRGIRAQVLEDLANELWDCGIYTVVTWQFIKQRAEAIRQGGAK
jgi:small-conductance mechanosensitive channel